MKKTIKLFLLWILCYIPIIILLVVFITQRGKSEVKLDKYSGIKKFVAKKFEFNNLLDLKNNEIALGYSADITLVDFWFSGCVPCVNEMREFNALISGRENEINIVSISIEGNEYWKRSFQENSPLSFLRKETSNWKHYNISDSTFLTVEKKLIARGGPGLNFTKELGLNAFPSYLVLDKNGVLIDLPDSGVDYIREKLYNQSYWRIFFTSPRNKGLMIKSFIAVFVLYSVIYWTVILILLVIRRFKRKSKVAYTLQ